MLVFWISAVLWMSVVLEMSGIIYPGVGFFRCEWFYRWVGYTLGLVLVMSVVL